MYPFERFTETSKRVLTLAQEEAERSHHNYIGTEHILLAFVRLPESVAGVVLDRLGVDALDVRRLIDVTINRDERLVIQHIIPTSRVKKIIDLSFSEARGMGDPFVGTEHLLLGMLIEGEGVAAHVLNDLGIGLENVRAEIGAVRKDGATAENAAPHRSVNARGASLHTSTHPQSGLRLVLFERAGESAGDNEPLYVNPVDVVRVDPVDESTTTITLRQGTAAPIVVRGGVHDVARRLTDA
ncbi:MAG TPA: Clp protease N-terminal domain-containing protein [Candidatus Dormibacteraeota bacterium]